MRNLLKRRKNQFSDFFEFFLLTKFSFLPAKINDTQTPLPRLHKSGHIGRKDAQCAETCEKTIFRYLVFEIWLILYAKFVENLPQYHHK